MTNITVDEDEMFKSLSEKKKITPAAWELYRKLCKRQIKKRDNKIAVLNAALFNIYVASNDKPFIKAQIESFLVLDAYRAALAGEKKDGD